MRFDEVVKIDASFQNSINIGLDMNDSEKINSYIPTTTGMDFLEHFLMNVNEMDGDHSTMLIAPYGKGKSHSVLVLLSLLTKTDYTEFEKLISKIQLANPGLYELINSMEKKKYFPIIVSNTRGTLNQALMYSLHKSLKIAGIENLTIENDFFQVLDRINEWKNKYPETYNIFVNELSRGKLTPEKFLKGIKTFNESALNIFKKIHRKILSGAEFSTQYSLEVVDYYQKVSSKLVEKYGYDGVYIVFDEFSKFLESRDEKTVSNDMKIIQDLAELCNNSKTENIYLQLILHKPINDYLSVDKRIRNAFKGIEGRVNTYYFVSTLKNSFDLISNVLVKTDKYITVKNNNEKEYIEIVEDIEKLPPFYASFDADYLEKNLIDDCFPLHPITVYLLVKINEKVAQNERTLFTFLAKNTPNSLPSLLEKSHSDQVLLPNIIFDYFLNQLLEEKDDVNIQKITLNCLSALNGVSDKIERKFLKIVALLLIINEKDTLPSNISVISSALMIKKEMCEKILEKFVRKGILIKRHGGQIQFKINMDLNINNSIENLANTKFAKINIINEISKICDNKYVYPRTYNIMNSITRFYRVEYIYESDFLSIDNVDYYFKDKKSDGVILHVLREYDSDNSEKILKHVTDINNDLLVVIYPNEFRDYSVSLKKYLAVQSLIKDKDFLENNILVKNELELILDDTKEEIEEMIETDFSFSSECNHIMCTFNNLELNKSKKILSKNRILGDILSATYCRYPNNINLELINKNNVKGNYKNAREKVIDKILKNEIDYSNLGTSPEDTIVNCILVETKIIDNKESDELREIIEMIRNFLLDENENFGLLYDILMSRPYGLRKGVIPIFIAWVISKLKKCILINYKQQEVELSAQVIEAINENPENFYFSIDEINASKIKYIEDLGTLFGCEIDSEIVKNYNLLTTSIVSWYVSLPKFTKQMIGIGDSISGKKYKMLRKQLNQTNINASEFILFSLPKLLGTNELDKAIVQLTLIKKNLDSFYEDYLSIIKKEVNEMIGFDKNTVLTQSLNYWIKQNKNLLEKQILESNIKDFIDICDNSLEETENSLINKIAYCFTTFFVEDWSSETHELFKNQLNKLILLLNEDAGEETKENTITLNIRGNVIVKEFDENIEDSLELVENFIDSTIEDYGDLLTNKQKISLLVRIMKKYL